MDNIKRLILGTANIGRSVNYWRSCVSTSDAEKILCLASALWGIDTARAYEDAEKLIGANTDHRLHITTKGKTEELETSLEYLSRTHVYGYFAHRMDRVWEHWGKFGETKRRRLTRKIGFSIYEPHEIAPSLVDIVQLPWNLGEYQHNTIAIDYLKHCGIEVHIRSIFGRGTLIEQFGVKGCLKAACQTKADKIVVGVDTTDQLKQNLDVMREIESLSKDECCRDY